MFELQQLGCRYLADALADLGPGNRGDLVYHDVNRNREPVGDVGLHGYS